MVFNKYFHGDSGAGLGATHQTGWTGLVADLICRPDPFATDASGWEWWRGRQHIARRRMMSVR